MSGSTALVLVVAVCVLGLLALGAATFIPGLSLPSRRRPERAPKQLTDLADRLSPYAVTRPAVIDLTLTEGVLAQAAASRLARPTAAKRAPARKSSGAKKSASVRKPRGS